MRKINIFEKIAKFSVRWRWIIIAVWIIAVPVAIKTLPSLSSVSQTNNSSFLPASSPSEKAQNLVQPFEGKNTSSTTTIVAYSSVGPLTAADQAAIARIESKVKSLPNVSLVKVEGTSQDGQVSEILVGNSSAGFGATADQFVTAVRNSFNQVNRPSNLSFHLTGTLAESVDENNSNNSARNNTQLFIIIFIIVLLFIVFKSLLAPLITLLPAALSLAIASPIIAESTKIGVQVSVITQLLLIVLLLGAGTDYGIFLVFRVREELRLGAEPKEAVVRALTKVGKVITFSALTVSAALISLLLASFGFYRGLGPALAIGIGILLLSGLTLLPALLTVFGRAAFWPVKNKPIKQLKLGVWGRVADRVITHPVITLVAGVIILGALCLGLVGYKTGVFANASPPTKSDSAMGTQIITDHFPAASNNPQTLLIKFSKPIWNNLQSVASAQSQLAASPVFKSIEGPLNPGGAVLTPTEISQLHTALGSPNLLPASEPTNLTIPEPLYQAYRSMIAFVSPNGQTVQFYGLLSSGISGSNGAINAIPGVRSELSKVASNVGGVTSGDLSIDGFSYDISHITTNDLYHIVPVVLVVIGVLLAILLLSLVAPWYLIITVGLSYLATLGFANIVFVHLTHNSTGLSFFLPFLLFIFCMALGEDYNILVMSRIREEDHGKVTVKQAVTKAIGVTGTTVTSAGLILAGTFAVLGIAGGQVEIQQIGYSIAFGILLDTFFVRTLLVPSIVVLLGKWNWWPSKLSRTTSV